MRKRVVDLGNCSYDHGQIRSLIGRICDAEVVQTHNLAETVAELEKHPAHLVLINRQLDADHSDGIEVLKTLKADARFASIPIMIITNYPEFQAQAESAGAEPGFGKRQLQAPETAEKLSRYLG